MPATRWSWGPRLALWAAATMATACGSHLTAISARSTGPSSTTTSTAEATGTLSLGDADNGGSATVPVGKKVVLSLASTYWTISGPSNARVLSQDAQPTVIPGGASCPKIPGTGCGTVVATFTASAPGQADLGADRTSCGEALRCSEAQAHWRFHVLVAATATTPPPVRATTTTTIVAPSTVPTPTTAAATVQVRGGVSGTVLFSPVCPVERVPPDPGCAPRPGAAAIHLLRTDDGRVVSGLAGTDGRFSIPAEPGTYAVKATSSAPSPARGCSAKPSQVTVAPGAVASVSVSCDTGIR